MSPTTARFAAPAPPQGLAGPVAELPWLGLPLHERQDRALLGANLRTPEALDAHAQVPPGGMLLLREDAAITAEAVTAFLAAVTDADASFRASGRSGALADELALGAPGPLLVYLAPGGAPDAARIAAAPPLEIDVRERLVELPVSRLQFGADVLELPLADALVLPAGHWLQLLWANLLGLGPHLWRGLAGRNVVAVAWRLGWAVLGARSTSPHRIAARLNQVGKGCRIHPTATVEGCVLGAGVEIGAHTVVRGCVLGDGVVIEDLSIVEFCVLAAGARVQRQALFKFSIAREGAAAAGAMQLGVLDRHAALKYGAVMMDMTLGQAARVRAYGALVPAPLGLAGVCVGEGTLVGVGVQVAPGRVLPPGLTVLAGGDHVLRVVPEGLSGTVAVSGGTLVARS